MEKWNNIHCDYQKYEFSVTYIIMSEIKGLLAAVAEEDEPLVESNGSQDDVRTCAPAFRFLFVPRLCPPPDWRVRHIQM